MFDFTGKTALVTGGSRGIGRAIATTLARGKASVALNYAGNDAAAEEARALCEEAGAARVKLMKFDVADPAACNAAVDEIVKEWGGLHVLVNNAGISLDQLIMRFKDEDWDRTIDVNLTGTFNLIRAATRPMMKQRGGAIVNLTSVVGECGNAGQAAYAAAKAGQIGLTKSIAKELASRNIRVNAVAPGFIDTDMVRGVPPHVVDQMVGRTAARRLGRPEEVAAVYLFLASDAASFINGAVVGVDGGLLL
jgi:3-oxoacyl-[acyl-carrier protein] reductase